VHSFYVDQRSRVLTAAQKRMHEQQAIRYSVDFVLRHAFRTENAVNQIIENRGSLLDIMFGAILDHPQRRRDPMHVHEGIDAVAQLPSVCIATVQCRTQRVWSAV
jgi:hypothetical protein